MGYKQLGLEDKVAVVIGGSSGIGKTLALGLAHAGADVGFERPPHGTCEFPSE